MPPDAYPRKWGENKTHLQVLVESMCTLECYRCISGETTKQPGESASAANSQQFCWLDHKPPMNIPQPAAPRLFGLDLGQCGARPTAHQAVKSFKLRAALSCQNLSCHYFVMILLQISQISVPALTCLPNSIGAEVFRWSCNGRANVCCKGSHQVEYDLGVKISEGSRHCWSVCLLKYSKVSN